MKVGILSMQRVMNYGSFLQGYALKKIIENLGHQCEFIDIEQGRIFPELRRSYSFILKKVIDRFCKWDALTRLMYMYKFQRRFKKELFEIMGINVHTIGYFDLVVIGSDEVFNFAQKIPWGFCTQLYGRVHNTNKVISYAGSFGHTTMDDIRYFEVQDEIASSLSSMAAISVRDIYSFDIIKELTGKEAIINIDPVLLFDFTSYVCPVNKKDYIIVYSYPNRIKAKEEISVIKSFAKKYGKKLISIGFYFPWCDETIIPNPFEVLGYIKGADYIITDTFHGSVMSIKYNRPFAALVRSSNQQKMISLLSQFKLEDRIVSNMALLEKSLLLPIQYQEINEIIDKEKIRSLEYLKFNL